MRSSRLAVRHLVHLVIVSGLTLVVATRVASARSFEVTAKPNRTCAPTRSHTLLVQWKLPSPRTRGVVSIDVTLPDGTVQSQTRKSRQRTAVFRISFHRGGRVLIEAALSGARPQTSSTHVVLEPCRRRGGRRSRAGNVRVAPANGPFLLSAEDLPVVEEPPFVGIPPELWGDDSFGSTAKRCRGRRCRGFLGEPPLDRLMNPLTLSWDVAFPRVLDPQIAASRTHLILSMTGGEGAGPIRFYEKNGTLLHTIAENSFFDVLTNHIDMNLNLPPEVADKLGDNGRLYYGIDEYYDTRVTFDRYRKRFWIVALARNTKARNGSAIEKLFRRSKVVLAVSLSEDPRDGWRFYWWDAVMDDGDCHQVCGCSGIDYVPGDGGDYPSIGVTEDAILVTNTAARPNIFNLQCIFEGRYTLVTRLDASSYADGTPGPGDFIQYWRFPNGNHGTTAAIVQPAMHHTPAPPNANGQPAFALSTAAGRSLVVWGFYPHAPWIDRVEIPVTRFYGTDFSDPNDWLAPQKPGAGITNPTKINIGQNLSNGVLKAVFRNGRLYGTWQDCRQWEGASDCINAIRLVRVSAVNFPASVPRTPASGFIDRTFGKNNQFDDDPNDIVYYGWPAVDVNDDGHMVLNYSRTGETVFPEARFSVYFENAPDIHPSYLLRAGNYSLGGEATENTLPAGRLDLTGSSVDPFDDNGIWIVHPYAQRAGPDVESGFYRVAVGKVFGNVYPDLVIKDVTFGELELNPPTIPLPVSFSPGQLVDISVTVRNQGDGPAGPSVVRFLLSTDTTPGRGDFHVVSLNAEGIAAGEEAVAEETMVSLPREIPSGSFYVLAVADAESDVEEYSESNNSAALFVEGPIDPSPPPPPR